MNFRRLTTCVIVAAALAVPVGAGAETLIDKLLRVSGLTVAPGGLREAGDDVEAGNIWLANLDRQTVSALTTDGGYRSPIFSPKDGSVYALKGDIVARLPPEGGHVVVVQKVVGVSKLVGFDSKNTDEVVVLLDHGIAGSPLAVVSLRDGKVTALPYDAESNDQRRMLTQVRGQRRVYGDVSVYTQAERKHTPSSVMEWTDTYLRRGNTEPRNISACGGVNCVQPALSPDGKKIAFIKTARS